MGCNCGQKANSKVRWVYSYDGASATFKTEIEAKAARVRNGGKGTITVVNG